jgi:hypothetical protein
MSKFFGMCLAFIFSASAKAAVLIEPYGGYAVGSMSKTYLSTFSDGSLAGNTYSGSNNGFAYGGRVGLLLKHFVILAVEYQGVALSEKFSSSTTTANWDGHTLFGTFVFQSPAGFRLMGSYGWDAQADEATTPDKTHYKGSALKLAIGWHLPMPVAINLEYTIYKFNDATNNGTKSAITSSYSKFDYSTVMATLSFPLTLGHMMGGSHSSSSSSHSR